MIVPRLRWLLPLTLVWNFLGVGCVALKAPLRWAESGVEAPAGWSETPQAEAGVDEDWVRRFADRRLQALIREALENNRDLRAAAARVEQARQQARIVGAAALPTADAGFGAQRQKQNFIGLPIGGASSSPGGVFSNRYNQFNLKLNVNWELDVWGRIQAGKSAAYADAEAAQADQRAARAALAAQVARTWFVAVEARRQVDLAQEAETLFQDTADAVRDRFERGQDQGQAAQLRLAETDVATARAARLERQQVLESTVRQLEVLLGRHPGGKMEVPSQLAALPRRPPAGLPSELLLRRPDVVAAERRFAASGRRLLEARRALFPQISLTGGTGTSSGDLADLLDSQFGVWNLAGNLAQPILTGGRLRGEVKVRDAKEKELLESLQQTVLDAFGEVETALAVDPLLAQRQAALQQALELAEQANEAAREEFAGGTGDLLTVFSAQNRLIQLRSQAVTLQRLRLENRINLHLALGGDFELHAAGTGAGE